MMREADYRRRIIRSGLLLTALFWRYFTDGGSVRDHCRAGACSFRALREEASLEARSAIASRDQLAATNAAIAELNKLSVFCPIRSQKFIVSRNCCLTLRT